MENDIKIQELLKKVEEKKAAIQKAERPVWETNCSFRWSSNSTTNLHVADVDTLVSMLAFLIRQSESHATAEAALNVESPFLHGGFTYKQWLKDIKLRLSILEVATTKKQLAALEEKLNQLMSPEMKAKKSLEEIEALLKD
jgi:hypothetical protein